MSCNYCKKSLLGAMLSLLARNADAHILTDKCCKDVVLVAR